MTYIYKRFPAMLLALSAVFHTAAQPITWEPLNGPSGVYAHFSPGPENRLYRYMPASNSWAPVILPFGNSM